MSMIAKVLSSATVMMVAAGFAASAEAATKSPFCFAGSPTPKYVCDAIKANTKPKPAPRVRHETSKTIVSNVR